MNILRKLVKNISDERWNIGFVQNDMESVLRGRAPLQVQWLKHSCNDCWFADPFILDVTDDEIQLLVEEYYNSVRRGHISRLVVDRHSFELKDRDVILELPTHLSFPAIIRKGDEVFFYPENGESGELNMYQYYPDSGKCVKTKKLLDEPVWDAVVATINGKEMLFCTKMPNPNGNVLCAYEKNTAGDFIEFGQYSFDENIARMAGDFFEYGGKLYRPTQECNYQYGHAVTLQEVNFDGGRLQFKEVRRLYSVHPKLNVGLHTWNMYKGIIVTDALGFDRMWIRNLIKILGVR